MSDKPPSKKLCQKSITDMFKPSPRSSAELDSKKKHANPPSVDEDSMKACKNLNTETSKSHKSPKKVSVDSNQGTKMDIDVECKNEKREEKKNMKPGGHSSDAKGDESVKGKERSPDIREYLARAAERRMKAAKSAKKSPCGSSGASGDEKEWCGVALSSLPRLSATNPNVPPVTPAPNHTVLVRLPVSSGSTPLPYPSSYSDIWDQHHVRMPCSSKSQYPKNKDSVVPRWSVISEALQKDIKCVEDLERAILQYNTRYASKWKFRGLHLLLEQEFEEEECSYFFENTLPAMVQLALRLPQLVTQAPPLLVQGNTHSLTLSQMQIACLLANAFFCTFPRRNAKGNDTEYARYPDINFNRLFLHREQRSLEKMKCLLHYFRRVTTKPPTGLVTFTRQTVPYQDLPNWVMSNKLLPKVHISSSGLIEEAQGLLQVDFANKYLGGGVLGLGCVQEEIRFVLCPELIVSRLFTQALEKTDALIITGCEQYSRGSGYASTFLWDGPYEDTTPVDQWGRRLCQVTAIDALHFTKQPNIQYKPTYITRELNKAYAGFKVIHGSIGVPTAVATGNWGCGAFKGNPRLKALIQLAVCGLIGRDLAYFTFGDEKLRDDLFTMHTFLKENDVTVGNLIQVLNHHGYREFSDGSDLFHFICNSLGSYESDTDQETSSKDSTDVQVKTKVDEGKTKEGTTRPSHSHSSSHSSTHTSNTSSHSHASGTSQSRKLNPDISDCFPEPGHIEDRSLSSEKILQVLSECDRLLENETLKNIKAAGNGDANANLKKIEECVSGKKAEKAVPKPNKQPSRLFDLLDEIDKKASE